MQKKLFISVLVFGMMFAIAGKITKISAKEEASGYHIDEIINDKFNKESIDPSWTLNNSETNLNYYGLHCISPVSYGSGPIINAARMSQNTRYEFSIYPNSGMGASNISFNIGMESPTSPQKEPDVDARVQLWNHQLVFVDYQNNLALPSGDISHNVLPDFSGIFTDLVRTDVAFVIKQINPQLTQIYCELSRNGEMFYSSESKAFNLKNPRYPNGYSGFFWDCTEMDITNFKMYNDNVLVLDDDFSNNTLTYPSTDYSLGNFHINSVLNETNCYISKVSTIKMDKNNASIINDYQLTEKENVSNPYEFKYSIKVNELNDNSFFGFGFGLDNGDKNIDKKNAIGFMKAENGMVDVVAIKNGVVDRSNNYQIASTKLGIGKFLDYSIVLDYSYNAYLTVNGLTFKFEGIDFLGSFGVGLVDINTTTSSSVELKEVVLKGNSYKNYDSPDFTNSFLGKKENENNGFDDPYINSQKYFLGVGVSLDEDWATGETSVYFSNVGAYSAFGPRTRFQEFILEYDLEVITDTANNFIGISFGRESVVDVLVQASTTSSSYFLRCDKTPDGSSYTTQLVWGANTKFENGLDYMSSDVNIYGTNSKYHMMFVGKNRSIYVYYKEIGAPDSELGILRAVIPNVNIDGYVSIVGNNFASFKVTNYKLVNLSDACKEESAVTLRESFDTKSGVSEKLSIDDSKVKNGNLVMNNSTISMINPNLYGIIRFTTLEIENSLQIMFSKGKKIIFDAKNNQIVFKEDGKTTKFDCSDINLKNSKGKRFEITILGSTVKICYKGYYDPVDKLSSEILTYDLLSPLVKDNIIFNANGSVTLDDLYFFALDNSLRCETYNYADDPDNANVWQVKKDFDPSKVYKEEEGCASSVISISLITSLLALPLFLRKKED